MHISNVCASGRNCISLSLHARIDFVSLACVRVCVASPNQQGSLSDGGEGEEEQEASRAVRSRHCRNIWQRLTLTHKHTHTHITPCLQTHTHTLACFCSPVFKGKKEKMTSSSSCEANETDEGGGENTGRHRALLHKTRYRPPLGPVTKLCVCESVHMDMRMLACSSVCDLSICALLHQGVSLQKVIITYLTAEKQSIMSRGNFTASQSL